MEESALQPYLCSFSCDRTFLDINAFFEHLGSHMMEEIRVESTGPHGTAPVMDELDGHINQLTASETQITSTDFELSLNATSSVEDPTEKDFQVYKSSVAVSEDLNSKPKYSYKALIIMALQSNLHQRCTLKEIYSFICTFFPYYGNMENKSGWEASIRHNLSLEKNIFENERISGGKGGWWRLKPNVDIEKHCKIKGPVFWSRKSEHSAYRLNSSSSRAEQETKIDAFNGSTFVTNSEILAKEQPDGIVHINQENKVESNLSEEGTSHDDLEYVDISSLKPKNKYWAGFLVNEREGLAKCKWCQESLFKLDRSCMSKRMRKHYEQFHNEPQLEMQNQLVEISVPTPQNVLITAEELDDAIFAMQLPTSEMQFGMSELLAPDGVTDEADTDTHEVVIAGNIQTQPLPPTPEKPNQVLFVSELPTQTEEFFVSEKQNDFAFFTPPPIITPDNLPIQTDEGIFNDTEVSEILRPKKLIFEDSFGHDSAAQENENEVKRKRKREHHSNTIDYNEILISKKYKLET